MSDLKIEHSKMLVLASFTGTIANTKKVNHHELNLDSAHQDSIRNIFGDQGLQIFIDDGGLQNRSPIEVIMSLVCRKELLEHLSYYCHECGIDIHSRDPIPKILREFKNLNINFLKNMLGSICKDGKVWPEIYPGFREFQSTLNIYNMDLGIVSSGYNAFIKDVFKFHGLKEPILSITPDDSFDLFQIDWQSKSKPSVYLIALALDTWMKENPEIDMDYARQNVVLIGDDLDLDGKMADNAGIPFWLFSQDTDIVLGENQRLFSHYGQLTNAIKEGKLFL